MTTPSLRQKRTIVSPSSSIEKGAIGDGLASDGVQLSVQGRRRFLAAAMLTLMGGGVEASTAAISARTAGKPHDLANILDFHMYPASDWTAALMQASAVAKRVYIPRGEYVIRSAILPSDTELFGDGDSTVLRMPSEADVLLLADSGSADINQNVSGISIRDMQLQGMAEIDGFSEFKHLVSFNGVSGARFTRVLFKAFRGDAIYLGAGRKSGVERHNSDIVIDTCRFDGGNRANRNAITAIDCDGLLIENCSFLNTTRHNMPGAIDLEPNAFPYHVIKNVTIRRNRFEGIGGNVGVIAVYVPDKVAHPPQNISVEDNESINYVGTGSFFAMNDNRRVTEDSASNNVRLVRNRATGGAISFVVASGRNITIEGNTFADFFRGGVIGAPGGKHSVRDLQVTENTLIRCGTKSTSAVYLYSAEFVRIGRNTFIDSGQSTSGNAIMFLPGRSSHIEILDNEFRMSAGRTGSAIQFDRRHGFEAASNRISGNRMNGLASAFPAAD